MMKDMSFIEKLKVLADVSSSSGICIASIFIILFVAITLLSINKKNTKKVKIAFILSYIVLITVMLFVYQTSLSSMFDYMMNNFFIVVYFPNLAIYLAAIIASNIIVWKTVFNKKKDNVLKTINVVMYSLMHYLLILILNTISKAKLDVFDNSSVYGNEKALALIGISSTIFIIWIVFMIIYSIIRSRQGVNDNVEVKEIVKVKTVYKNKLPANILEVAKPKQVREVVKYKLPSNIIETIAPAVAKEVKKYQLPKNTGVIRAPKVIKDYGIKQIVAPKLANVVNIKKAEFNTKKHVKLMDFTTVEEKEIKQYDNILSLDDYKTVLDLLKNKDKYIDNNTYNNYTINNVVQPKLDELLNLNKA